MRNVLDMPLVGRVLRSAWLWRGLRLLCLAVLVWMIAAGWHHRGIPGVAVPDPLMYTNLATHLFWVWWIMGVVFVALLFGRLWCAVCPLGWVNGLATRLGLQRPLPAWLNNFIPVTLALLGVQLAVYFLAIHRFPDLTARLLALMLMLALACGLVFRGHAFCRLLCPAGAVFGLYARLAPWQLRVGSLDICASCADQACVSGGRVWRRLALGPALLYWHGRRKDCPVDLVPAQMTDSAACTLCLHCVHNCGNDNLILGRRPWLGDLGRTRLSASETLFFLVLLGLLTVNFTKVYPDLRHLLWAAPEQAAILLGWQSSGFYLLAAPWAALLLPLLLMLPGYLVWRLSDLRMSVQPPPAVGDTLPEPQADPGFWNRLGHLALPLVPLVLTVHIILAAVKINTKGSLLPLVLHDPSGVKSYLAMNVVHSLPTPGLLMSLDLLKWLIAALLVAGTAVSILSIRPCLAALPAAVSRRGFAAGVLTTLALLAGLYGTTILRWLFIR
ncbi:4Fe-4S binding protein [Geoalkalibacter halelectricus]|uniref:4Fe-4S binding protein n=1 Tax=Geoalkalibacter halelectricus TaxID=2847045 RepID=UPI003D192787